MEASGDTEHEIVHLEATQVVSGKLLLYIRLTDTLTDPH